MASIVDRPKLKSLYENTVKKLRENDDFGRVKPSVSTKLVENVRVESTFVHDDNPYTMVGDESLALGGSGAGPSPIRYFLSGLGFCLQVWYAKGSAVHDCDITSMTVDLETFLDIRGEHGFEDVPSHIQRVIVSVFVETDADPDLVLAVTDWGNLRCPLSGVIRKAIPVYDQLTVNGTLIRDTVPSDLE